MWIFKHNFVADKAKIRRRAVARQVFFTQYAAKFAKKARVSACEDGFLLYIGGKIRNRLPHLEIFSHCTIRSFSSKSSFRSMI